MGSSRRFSLRYGRASKLLLILLASGPGRSGVVVDDAAARIEIRMGVCFRGDAGCETVRSVRKLSETVISRGVHGWWGDWLVNGAGDRLVEVRFEPPMRAHVLGFPIGVRRLRISVDDPDGLVDTIAPFLTTTP